MNKKIIAMSLIGLFTLTACGSENHYKEASTSSEETHITEDMFNQIEEGMTSSEVYEIVQGYPTDIIEMNGYDSFLYSGSNDASVTLNFINDKVSKITEYGLTSPKKNTIQERRSTETATTNETTNDAKDITEDAIKHAEEIIKEYEEVKDAHISYTEEQITFALIVTSSTNEDTSKELLENFVRALGSGTSIYGEYDGPENDSYGSLYNEYDIQVAAGTSAEDIQVHGAKNRNAKSISF